MKNSILLMILMFCTLMLSACGPASYTIPVPTRQGLTNGTISNIQPVNKSAQYEVKSALASDIFQAYEYNSNGKTPTKYFFQVDIQNDINKAAKSYVETKFLSTSKDAKNILVFDIKDFYIEYTMITPSPMITAMTNTFQTVEYVKTRLTVNVSYIKNGKSLAKEYTIENEYKDSATEPMRTAPQLATEPIKYRKGMDNIASSLLNESYNELIIKTDKFITAAETLN